MAETRRRRRPFPFHIVVFLAPATIVYTLFMVYPLADSLRLSLFAPVEGGGEVFAGLDNYVRLLTDDLWSDRFWGALKNNFVFFVIHMAVQNPIGLMLAALLSARRLRLRHVYRTMIFTPTMLSVVIIGFAWQLILSPLWGVAYSLMDSVCVGWLVNWMADVDVGWLRSILPEVEVKPRCLSDLFRPWLGEESTALITLSLISVWQFVGIPMMLIYAALLNIPDDLIDAATVDGANHYQVFWRVKLPLIWPTIGIVSILTFVGNFNAFDLIYAVKGALAGPNFATDIMGTLFYRTFFGFQLQLGNPTMGAAIATLMFLIILTGVMIYFFIIQRRMQRYEL